MGVKLTGTVYSSRERVNVIAPGTGNRGEGNHFFMPANKAVTGYIRKCIAQMILDEYAIGVAYRRKVAQCYSTPANEVYAGTAGKGLGNWAKEPYTVFLTEIARGEYRYAIYQAVTESVPA